MSQLALGVDGLRAGYGEAVVLRDVTFGIEPGEIFTVLGKNGMGKSTLLKTLMGFLPVKAGRVAAFGQDITGLPPHRVARRGTAPPIATARAQAIGSQVMVDGVVTVAPRTFDEGFALQDASGGIYVARALDQAIQLGSRVRVTGTLAAPDKRITVEPTALQITGQGSAPAPLEVATGDVGPATEGRLLAVRGRAIVDDRPWGSKLYVNDGSGPLLVFIAAATSIDGTRYRAGQALRIVGFSGRFGDHTEVLPRGPSDIGTGPM